MHALFRDPPPTPRRRSRSIFLLFGLPKQASKLLDLPVFGASFLQYTLVRRLISSRDTNSSCDTRGRVSRSRNNISRASTFGCQSTYGVAHASTQPACKPQIRCEPSHFSTFRSLYYTSSLRYIRPVTNRHPQRLSGYSRDRYHQAGSGLAMMQASSSKTATQQTQQTQPQQQQKSSTGMAETRYQVPSTGNLKPYLILSCRIRGFYLEWPE